MSDIVAIGEYYYLGGLAAFGVEIYPAEDSETAREVLDKVLSEEPKIIMVSEMVYKASEDKINRIKSNSLPSILVLPLPGEGSNIGSQQIRAAMLTAVGVDILQN